MAQKMTPEHPDWQVFFLKLVMELNFRNEYKGNKPAVVDDCDDTFIKSMRILTRMGDIDVSASLAGFREQGVDCDCKVCLRIFYGKDKEGGE
jgi:hypothetical protein